MDWSSVNCFVDSLTTPQENQPFEEWFDEHWKTHRLRCRNAAMNNYVLQQSVATFKKSQPPPSEEKMKRYISSLCLRVGLEPTEYIEMSWPTFKKKCQEATDL